MPRIARVAVLVALIGVGAAHALDAFDSAPHSVILKIEPGVAQRLLAGTSAGTPALDDYLARLSVDGIRQLAKPRLDGRNEQLRERFGTSGIVALH